MGIKWRPEVKFTMKRRTNQRGANARKKPKRSYGPKIPVSSWPCATEDLSAGMLDFRERAKCETDIMLVNASRECEIVMHKGLLKSVSPVFKKILDDDPTLEELSVAGISEQSMLLLQELLYCNPTERTSFFQTRLHQIRDNL